MAKLPESSSSNPEQYKQLEFDLAQAAHAAELVLGTTIPEDKNYPETLRRRYLEELKEDRLDARRTNAPWRDGGDGKETPSSSPNVSGKPTVYRRHISRTGPRRPRDSKGQSKYVTYPPIPEYTPLTDEEVEVAREARKAYEARKAEKAE